MFTNRPKNTECAEFMFDTYEIRLIRLYDRLYEQLDYTEDPLKRAALLVRISQLELEIYQLADQLENL